MASTGGTFGEEEEQARLDLKRDLVSVYAQLTSGMIDNPAPFVNLARVVSILTFILGAVRIYIGMHFQQPISLYLFGMYYLYFSLISLAFSFIVQRYAR